MTADHDLTAELIARVEAASRTARDEVKRAKVLVDVSEAIRDEILTGRCAWCGRYRLGDVWLERGALPRFATSSVGRIGLSHTICPDCVDELRRTGKSV